MTRRCFRADTSCFNQWRQAVISGPVGLFSGGQTFNGVCNATVNQTDSVVSVFTKGAGCPAVTHQGRVKKFAGDVSGKGAAGMVCAAAGGETDDQ